MIRNLKALGLALAALFAMSAVVASAASAQTNGKLTTGTGEPVTLTGTETAGVPASANQFTAFGASFRCPGSTLVGHKLNWTPHTLLTPGETAGTLTPKFAETKNGAPNCFVAGLGWSVTFDLNGCDLAVHAGETTGGGETYGGTADVVCPQGHEGTITMWTTETEHTNDIGFDNPFCVIHIGEAGNQGLKGAHATNLGGGDVRVHGTAEGITATKTASASHPVLCAAATTSTAKFNLDGTASGENALGATVAISISD